MLTADTITDEQIRELKLWAEVRFERGVAGKDEYEAHEAATEASVPRLLIPMLSHEDYMATMQARARCAEILNTRTKEAKLDAV